MNLEQKIPFKIIPTSTQLMNFSFFQLMVGEVFQSNLSGNNSLMIGTDEGKIMILKTDNQTKLEVKKKRDQIYVGKELKFKKKKISNVLESKGSVITSMECSDLTMFGKKDLIVGDSEGFCTIFSEEKILLRKKISENSISSICVHKDFCNTPFFFIFAPKSNQSKHSMQSQQT